MSLSDELARHEGEEMGRSASEFLAYCEAERERRLNSGEAFDEEMFEQAVERVLTRLRLLAEEGWT